MYLKTPKSYRPKRRRFKLFGRWWWLYILTPIAVVAASLVWANRTTVSAFVFDWLSDRANDVRQGVETMQAPTATATESPEIYLEAGQSAYNQGAMDEAIRQFTAAANAMPNNVAVHYILTHLLVTTERVEDSLDWAEKTVNADPYDSRGWAIRGMADNWAGENEEAIASLLRAIELDPENATAHAFLAETYWDTNQPDLAFDEINTALALDPDRENFNVQRSVGYIFQVVDPESATEGFERALQLAPMHAYIAEDYANHLFRQGEVQRGVDLLQGVVERNPEDASAQYSLARALYNQLGQVDQAREVFERCVTVDPNYVPCLTFLGAIQIQSGEFNLCARNFQRAIDAGTQNPRHYYSAGICYSAINECSIAIDIYYAGLELAQEQDDIDNQEDIQSGLAGCQVVITLEPTATPLIELTPEGTPPADEGDTSGSAVQDDSASAG